MNPHERLHLARQYSAAGINVLPIRPDGSKSPAIKEWKHLQLERNTEEEIVRFFNSANGIAAVAGAISGYLEDFDFDEVGAFEEWKLLIIENLGKRFWDRLLVMRTPRPGIAVIIRCPSGIDPSQKLAQVKIPNPEYDPTKKRSPKEIIKTLIETKAEGGYFLLPGCPAACHPTGRLYELLQGSFKSIPEITTDERSIMLSCARSLCQVARTEYQPKQSPRTRTDGEISPGDDFNSRGPAWNELLQSYGFKLASQRGATSYWTRPGKDSGISASSNHGGNDLFYPFSTNLQFDTDRGYRKFAVFAFLAHDGDFKAAARALSSQGYGVRKSKDTDAASEVERPTKYSDDALADQFSSGYADDFKYVDSWGWLQWTGQRWRRVPDIVVMDRARLVCRSNAQRCRIDVEIPAKAREGLARQLASAKVVSAVVKLAKGDKRHYSMVEEWDSHRWLFNTPNGTIDLKSGALRKHQSEDRITKIAYASPAGECELWLAFLVRVTGGNTELQAYLQRLAGYAMCGDPSEECLDFFYGDGGNGKGVFLKTLQYIFGEYSTTAATETFMESKGEKHPTDVAKLAGARLVVAQEVNEGQHWNESRLKTMTGRDELTARFMRRDLFDFTPEFTLIISGNNKPALKSVDEAWRRRFHVVPFEVCIPKTEQNPNLKDELRAERDGILNWCLAGCLEWQQQRLNPPDAILVATAEYLSSEDTLEMWIEECCLVDHEGYEEASQWLHVSHRRWKESRGEKASGTKIFGQRLSKHGFHPGKNSAGTIRVFRGVRLTDVERKAVKAIIETQRRREQGISADTTEDDDRA